MNNPIAEDGIVLLHFDVRRQWLVRVDKDREFHTHKGYLKLASLIGKPYGSEIKSSLGYSFWALQPSTFDLIMHTIRKTQIMYPKDIGLIILKLSLHSGAKVLEIGTGSGAMTVAAATAVMPNGRVHTYEARKEFAEIAERNIKRARLSEFVVIHNQEASQGFEENDFDAAVIDVGDPWPIVPLVHAALKGGAPVVSFSPTVNQVEKTTEALAGAGFTNIQTIESFIREIRAETGKTRPVTMMVGHTGYMTFAQKVLRTPTPE